MTVDVQHLFPGTVATLQFDLLSFADLNAQVIVDNVFLLGEINEAPLAEDDETTTDEAVPVSVSILNNDYDPDGTLDPESVQIVSPPEHGETSWDPQTRQLTYTPADGFAGFDSLTYGVADDTGLTSEPATLVIRVEGPPNIEAFTSTSPAFEGQTVEFDVLASDPNQDLLRYEWQFSDGTALQTDTDGNMTHVFRDNGQYPVTVRVSDGSLNRSNRHSWSPSRTHCPSWTQVQIDSV